jgi:hypothetical protein
MSRCRESARVQDYRVQDYLDRELAPERAAAFETHLADCPRCAAELASYRALFAGLAASLRPSPAWDPGPPLTERILDRVLPSRLRRRWVTAAGWVYGTAAALSTFLLASWLGRPETHVWLVRAYGEASLRVAQTALSVFQVVVRSWLEALQGWSALEGLLAKAALLARALAQSLSDPVLIGAGLAALAACAGLLAWMRSGRRAAGKEVRNVGLLCF